MKKSIVLICALLSMLMLFSSCAPASVSAFLGKYEYEETATLKAHSSVTALDSHSYSDQSGKLILFDKGGDKKIYNIETNTVVYSVLSKNYSSNYFFTCNEHSFFMLKTSDDAGKITTALYSETGTQIVSVEKNLYTSDLTVKSDLFQFDGKIYRVGEDGNATLVCETTFNGNIPSFDSKIGKYYYDVNGNNVTAYDENLNATAHWEIPFSVYSYYIHPMADGRILAQYLVALPIDAKSYDVLNGSTKYQLVSVLINAENGKERKINLDYIVDEVYNGSDMPFSDAKNFAIVYPIENKRIVNSDDKTKYVFLDNNAKIASEPLKGLKDFGGSIEPAAMDRFTYENTNGDTILIDAKGKKIGKLNGDFGGTGNEKYLIANGKIYDHDLKLVYSLEENKYTYVSTLAHGYILRDADGAYYLFKDGAATKIEGNVENLSRQLYIVRDKLQNKPAIYNDLGEKLLDCAVGDSISIVYSYENIVLIRVYGSNGAFFYRFSV